MTGQLVAGKTLDAAGLAASPLAVDLDGSLVRTDTLHEALVETFKHAPTAFAPLAGALSRGKAAFKRAVAEQRPANPRLLPY
ncbi:MAG: hypothetical protein H0V22_08600, partial [Solirubrobacterales bacterium]|nr:hypothetical protein [Solirubrobacterales bacterium]